MTVGELSDRMSSREFTDWILRSNIMADEQKRAEQRARRKR